MGKKLTHLVSEVLSLQACPVPEEVLHVFFPSSILKWLHKNSPILIFFLFFKGFIYLFIFRKSGREGEREGEKHQCVVAYHAPPTGDLAHNPGMCPDWESDQRPFGL